jgi:hypothetical protein
LEGGKGGWWRTQRGKEAGEAAADHAEGTADVVRGLRHHAAPIIVHKSGGRPHNDALVFSEVVGFRTVFIGLVQNRFELIAFVPCLGKEASKLRCWKVPMAEVCEEFPYLYDHLEFKKGPMNYKAEPSRRFNF